MFITASLKRLPLSYPPLPSLCRRHSPIHANLRSAQLVVALLTYRCLLLRRRLCLADYFSLNDENLDSLMVYILTQLVIICSPAAFLAFNYILYGRLLADNVRPEYSMMRPATVSKVFIISDVSTFFLQVSGGGMTATEKMASAGKSLMVFGLCAQLLSSVVFWVMFTVLHVRAHKAGDLRFSNSGIRSSGSCTSRPFVFWLIS